MFFVFLAYHFLGHMRLYFKARAPALTVYQVRWLLLSLQPIPIFDVAAAIRMVRYYQRRITPLIFLTAEAVWSGFPQTLCCQIRLGILHRRLRQCAGPNVGPWA